MGTPNHEKTQNLTTRQKAVLDSALQLLVAGGEKALTTSAIARSAGCSKESLYKWFGDRDGLLAAIVARQASKVYAPGLPARDFTLLQFTQELEKFAHDLLAVVSGEVSIALNRLAVSSTSKGDASLGSLLQEHGRGRIGKAVTSILQRGIDAGFLQAADTRTAYQDLYGLILRDLHLRLLLGDSLKIEETDFNAAAHRAIAQFMKLYGA
ncbi:TetR/AcrR family transcriptional regulator [Flexibacterium corallicola]|uniref:TetR/AcrR family transcriptional regulator n=1 Tax=Flexibacterium corallicola TaxID=3037259 RepID=UPI00286F5777|nr:TetR/AcrR family transcriptional regulator [Pseudovibrio sp. M1P-2-3]